MQIFYPTLETLIVGQKELLLDFLLCLHRKFYKFLKLEYLYLQQREPIILIFVHLGFTLRWLVAARCACGA